MRSQHITDFDKMCDGTRLLTNITFNTIIKCLTTLKEEQLAVGYAYDRGSLQASLIAAEILKEFMVLTPEQENAMLEARDFLYKTEEGKFSESN